MFLVSRIVDFSCWLCGDRFAFQIHIRRLERWKTFEREYYVLDHLISPKLAAIDVGANEGIYAGRMAQLTARVHCFEPIPWLASKLRKKLPSSVVVHECAASNTTGKAELRIPYHNDVEMPGTSTLHADNLLLGSTSVKRIICDTQPLDDVIQEPVGFIKIDVEGHEHAVLEGADRIIREYGPIVLVESERRHNINAPENVFRFFNDRGYSGLFLTEQHFVGISGFDTTTLQRQENVGLRNYVNNFIFIPNSLRSPLLS